MLLFKIQVYNNTILNIARARTNCSSLITFFQKLDVLKPTKIPILRSKHIM